MDNDVLLSNFAAQHFERHSISAGRRIETMRVLDGLSARIAPRALTELTTTDLMEWQAAELSSGNKPTTVMKKQTQALGFVRWANEAGLISWQLMTELKSVAKPRGGAAKKSPRPYTRAEIENLRIILNDRYPPLRKSGKGSQMLRRYARGKSRLRGPLRVHAIRLQYEAQIALALEEGLRATEIFNLTLAQMHPDNIGVLVETAKGKPGQKRERLVPYTEHARAVVREWLELRTLIAPPHDRPWLFLFWGDCKAPQSFVGFETGIRGMGYHWHRLRHTFATERLRAGLPLEKVQVMLGHANITQTLAYAQILSRDVVAEADRTEPQFARNLGLPVAV